MSAVVTSSSDLRFAPLANLMSAAAKILRVGAAGPLNWVMPTLGGKQIWRDEYLFSGWRIQRSLLTGHCRLLDDGNRRRAWGSYADCLGTLDVAKRTEGLAPRSDHLVVMLHGIGRSAASFRRMERAFQAAGYETAALNYPSTRTTIEEHARAIGRLLDRLEHVREVSFVTHSMGGLVLCHLLAQPAPWRSRMALGRAVMIAPPSRGAALADRVQRWGLYRLLYGRAGQQLTTQAAAALPQVGEETGCAVIAGGLFGGRGLNPLLSGDDDGVVSVAETRLEGAAHLVLPGLHSTICNRAAVIAAAQRFIATGKF